MIQDRMSILTSTLSPFKGSVGPIPHNDHKGGGKVALQGGSQPTFSLSRESQEGDAPSERIATLTNGLASWGQPEKTGEARGGQGVGEARGGQGVGEAGLPAQPPISLIRILVDQMKSTDGFAAVGTFGALLSWARKEKSANGEIRPEFQEILREAIAYARQVHFMKDEDLDRIEASLLGNGNRDAGNKKVGGSGKWGTPVVHPPRKGGSGNAPLAV